MCFGPGADFGVGNIWNNDAGTKVILWHILQVLSQTIATFTATLFSFRWAVRVPETGQNCLPDEYLLHYLRIQAE